MTYNSHGFIKLHGEVTATGIAVWTDGLTLLPVCGKCGDWTLSERMTTCEDCKITYPYPAGAPSILGIGKPSAGDYTPEQAAQIIEQWTGLQVEVSVTYT